MSNEVPETAPIIARIDFSQRSRHLTQISLWIPPQVSQELEWTAAFPVWTPGSYLVREYSRNIESITGSLHAGMNDSRGKPLPLERKGKNRWKFVSSPDKYVCLRYALYCHEMSVRTNWVDDEYAFLTGAATFPQLMGTDHAFQLELALPADWQNVASSLKEISSGGNAVVLRAESFDQLVDSPIVCGNFARREWIAGGKPHWLVNLADDRLWDLDQVVKDCQQIVEHQQQFWGEIPYEQFGFINLATGGRGGLEHDDSTVLMCSPHVMQNRDSYIDWLGLVSHEYFHVWNIRRLRPVELIEYDYQAEQHFRELWVAEGVTSYFDDLALVRCGLATEQEYLKRLSRTVGIVQSAYGQRLQSLLEASWDAWTKLYRPDENTPNARISYYTKGALVAWLLDIGLHQSSQGCSGLRDVMRQLWHNFREVGYQHKDVADIAQELGDLRLREWLDQVVVQAAPLDLTPALDWLGLEFKPFAAETESLETPLLGIRTEALAGQRRVTFVGRGTAGERARLQPADEIVALDGYRTEPDNWESMVKRLCAGDVVSVSVARRGRMLQLELVPDALPKLSWELQQVAKPTAEQAWHYDAWLGRTPPAALNKSPA